MIGDSNGCHLRVVMYEGPGSRPLGADERFEVLEGLLKAGRHVTRTANGTAVGVSDATAVVILGRFDGCSCRRNVQRDGKRELHYVDLAEVDAAGAVARVDQIAAELGLPKPGTWIPWYPVIDYERCANCGQCLSFCLFGVFDRDDDGLVEVRQPDHCKTACPACSRVCPNVAIMFPKYEQGPINGDMVRDEDVRAETVQVDVAALLGEDVHGSLRQRSRAARQRFRRATDSSDGRSDRVRHLKEMQVELGIPDAVISSLSGACACQRDVAGAEADLAQGEAHGETEADRPSSPPDQEWDL